MKMSKQRQCHPAGTAAVSCSILSNEVRKKSGKDRRVDAR